MIAAGLTLLAAVWTAVAAEPAALAIDVRARSLAPAELVRIDVSCPEELASVRCTFLDEPVFMAQGIDARHWSGWAAIPWDREPGPARIEAHGRTASGGECRGTRAVAIEAREFPTEHLRVDPDYVHPPPEIEDRLRRERELLAAIYDSRRNVPPARGPFLRPVPGEPTSPFGTRRVFNGVARDPHSGLDLRAESGTPVRAAGPGRVALARELYYSGNVVILDHGGGLFTVYAHLSRIDVDVGRDVRPGERVGLVGATGRVTGPHLHWGAKVGGRSVDPTALLGPELFR
jgi:murein DD-endopeptidase MepM/ murein hydrolase activator NlpD